MHLFIYHLGYYFVIQIYLEERNWKLNCPNSNLVWCLQ